MKTLNLVDIDKSDIKYQIQKFPDGQQNVVVDKNYKSEINIIDISHIPNIQIKSRLNNWLDLELIVCAVASLRLCGVKEIHLYVPYILGARSDRKFEIGGNRYIKDVIAPVLNSLNFESVTCIDPHSYVLENCINNFENISNKQLVTWAIEHIYKAVQLKKFNDFSNCILVSPDAGASHKIYKLAEQIGYKGDIITCSKERDTEGKLTKTVLPVTGEQHNMLHRGPYKDFIIIDDICDGGATFINIAKEIKAYFHESGETKSKIYLIVTHGIFSKGFKELYKYLDGIYCTNSYSDLPKGEQIQSIYQTVFKQLNVF